MDFKLRGSHFYVALDFMTFKDNVSEKFVKDFKDKLKIIATVTKTSLNYLVSMINDNLEIPDDFLSRMSKSGMKVPTFNKIAYEVPTKQDTITNEFESSTSALGDLTVMTKEEYEATKIK